MEVQIDKKVTENRHKTNDSYIAAIAIICEGAIFANMQLMWKSTAAGSKLSKGIGKNQ